MKKHLLLLLILVITGFYLRFYHFNYGLPGFYVSDAQTVSEAMDMGNALLQGNWAFFAEPVKYPFIIPYLLLFANGIIFGIAGLDFIALHQEIPFFIARFFSILAGTAIIPLTFFTARLLAKRFGSAKPESAAIISSFFSAFSLLLFQFSRVERPHIILGFFTLLSYFLYLKFAELPSKKNGLWLGMAVGLTAGTLQNGVLSVLFLVLPLTFLFINKVKRFDRRSVYCGLLAAAVIFFLSYPYLFLSPSEALNFGSSFDPTFSGSRHDVSPFSGQGFYEIFRNLLVYDPAIFILMIIAIFLLAGARKRFANFLRADAFGIFSYSVSFLLVFGFYSATFARFLIPLVLFIIIFSGVAISEFIKRGRFRIAILSLLCLLSFAQVMRMTFLLALPDTRDMATKWVRGNLTEKDTILIDAQNIANPIAKEAIAKSRQLGGAITRRDQLLLSLPDKDYPKDARNILRSWQLKIADYEKFIKENDVTHIIVSDGGGFRDSSDSLFIFAKKNFEFREIFSPFRKQSNSVSSDFPDELSNPIIDLWGIVRMGPEVRIYEKP